MLLRVPQITSALLLSLAYSGNVFRAAIGVFAAMLDIYKTGEVADPFPVPIWLRCMSGVLTASGAIIGGARFMPVTGNMPGVTEASVMPACTSYMLT